LDQALSFAKEIDLLVFAELSRWNIQHLQRQNLVGNLGTNNLTDSPGKKYKRAFFVDWRSADVLQRSFPKSTTCSISMSLSRPE
jgi:hypothetical protein